MIKNIVFDIGNVLVDYKLQEFLFKKGYDGTMIKRILKASIMTPYWEEFERDEINEDQAVEKFASVDPEIKDDIYNAYKNINGMLTIRDFAIDWVKDLKSKGYNVYYLSNYSRKAYIECADSIAFIEYMDGGFVSFQVKMTKPNPKMYELFLERYKLKAKECVFIDDTKENVDMAIQLGMKGIVFTTYEDTKQQLETIYGN